MYEKFYGLSKKPFHIVPNPDFLFLTSKHENALTYLEYGLNESVGFILLTGEVGTGKTTLIRHMLNQIDSSMNAAVIFNTNVSAEELLCLILQEFELTPTKGDKAKNLDLLYKFLIDKYSNDSKVLLIIDEAQNLSDEVLEEVRMLSNLHSDDQMLLQVMLVGQPELNARIRMPHLAQLAQRIVVNYHLLGLSQKETVQYIKYRLEKAGGKPNIFTPEAMDLIFKASAGIPRSINIFCDTALVYGFADEMASIDAPVIKQVIKDRGGLGQELDSDNGFLAQVAKTAGEKDGEGKIPAGLKVLVGKMQKLERKIEAHVDDMEQRMENFREETMQQLQAYILQERKKNGKLLGDYSQAKLHYHSLLRSRAAEAKKKKSSSKGA